MATVPQIFNAMSSRFVPGALKSEKTYYFSIGDHKYTVVMGPESCDVSEGKQGDADVVLKTTPKIFENLVMKGKPPGPLQIARGLFKTNDVGGLTALKDAFKFK